MRRGFLGTALFRQAYAKLHGSYDCLLRGHPPYALRDLTGGAPQASLPNSPKDPP